jgi:hypothetical protein
VYAPDSGTYKDQKLATCFSRASGKADTPRDDDWESDESEPEDELPYESDAYKRIMAGYVGGSFFLPFKEATKAANRYEKQGARAALALNAPGTSVLPRRMLPDAAAGATAAPVRNGARPAGADLRAPEHTADAGADNAQTDGEDDDEYEEQPDEADGAVDTGASAGAGQTVGDRDSDSDENSDSDDDVPTAELSVDDLIMGLEWSGKHDRRNLLDRAPDNLKTTNARGTARVEGPAHRRTPSGRARGHSASSSSTSRPRCRRSS